MSSARQPEMAAYFGTVVREWFTLLAKMYRYETGNSAVVDPWRSDVDTYAVH